MMLSVYFAVYLLLHFFKECHSAGYPSELHSYNYMIQAIHFQKISFSKIFFFIVAVFLNFLNCNFLGCGVQLGSRDLGFAAGRKTNTSKVSQHILVR